MIFPDMLVQPWIVNYGEIGARKPAMKLVTADAGPGGVVIGAFGVVTRADDIKKARKVFPDPGTGIVLVGDGINPELLHELFKQLRRAGHLYFPKRLCQAVSPSPYGYPQRTGIVFIRRPDDKR